MVSSHIGCGDPGTGFSVGATKAIVWKLRLHVNHYKICTLHSDIRSLRNALRTQLLTRTFWPMRTTASAFSTALSDALTTIR